LGSVASADIIWEGADLSLGIMTLINLAVLIIMSREIKEETELYFGKGKK
jgi:Na+/alanine symporter